MVNEIQLNFNGSNMFGTIETVRDTGSSSHWELIMVPGQEANSDNLRVFFIFCTITVYLVYSLESPRWGDSNEYTQHTSSGYNKKIFHKYLFSGAIGRISKGLSGYSHGKRAIGGNIEVRLYN